MSTLNLVLDTTLPRFRLIASLMKGIKNRQKSNSQRLICKDLGEHTKSVFAEIRITEFSNKAFHEGHRLGDGS